MNTTMEQPQMKENEMGNTMEQEMPEMMTANLAGEMPEAEDEKAEPMNPVDMLMGVVKNQINDLNEDIDEADKAFARAHHNDKYSKATYDAEETCKLLNAQKGILNKVLSAMEDMMSSIMPMSA